MKHQRKPANKPTLKVMFTEPRLEKYSSSLQQALASDDELGILVGTRTGNAYTTVAAKYTSRLIDTAGEPLLWLETTGEYSGYLSVEAITELSKQAWVTHIYLLDE